MEDLEAAVKHGRRHTDVKRLARARLPPQFSRQNARKRASNLVEHGDDASSSHSDREGYAFTVTVTEEASPVYPSPTSPPMSNFVIAAGTVVISNPNGGLTATALTLGILTKAPEPTAPVGKGIQGGSSGNQISASNQNDASWALRPHMPLVMGLSACGAVLLILAVVTVGVCMIRQRGRMEESEPISRGSSGGHQSSHSVSRNYEEKVSLDSKQPQEPPSDTLTRGATTLKSIFKARKPPSKRNPTSSCKNGWDQSPEGRDETINSPAQAHFSVSSPQPDEAWARLAIRSNTGLSTYADHGLIEQYFYDSSAEPIRSPYVGQRQGESTYSTPMMGSEGVFSPLIPRKSGQISVTILEDVPQPALSPPEPIWYSSFPPSCPSNLGLAILTSTGAMSEGRTQDGSLHPVTKVPDFTVSESDYGLGGRSMAKINLGTPKINKTQSFQFNRDRSGSESSSISAATVEKGMLWQNLPTGPLRAGTPLLVGSCDNLAAISVSSSDRSLASRVKGEEIIQANMGPGVIGRASEEEPTSRLPVPDVGNKVEFQSSKISLGKDTLVSKVARKSHAEDRIIFSGTISQKFRDPTVHIDQHCVTSPPLMTTGDDDETAAIDQALRSIEALITDYRSPKSYFPDKRMELSRRRSLDLPVNGAAALIPFTPSTAKTATRKRSATDVTAENRKMSRHFEERRGSLLSGKRICPAKGHTSQPSLSHRTRPSTTSSSMSFYSAGSTPPTSLIRTVHKLKYEGLKLKTNYHRQNPRNLSGSKSDIFSPSAASDDAAEALNAFFESRSIPYPNGSETSRKSDGCGEAAQHDSVILPSTINEESMSDSRSDGSSASSSDQTLVEPFHCGTNDSMASVLELDVEALCSISIGTSNPGLGIDLSQKKMPTSFKVGDKACTSAKMDENQHGFSNLTGALPDMRDSWTFLMSTPTKAFPAGNQKECSRRFVRWHSQPHGSPSPAQKITHAIPTRATTLDLGTRRSGKADIAPIIEISMDTPLSISPGSPPRAKLINEAASPLRRGRKSFGSEYNSPTLSVVRLYENRHSNSSFPEREISP